VDKYGTQQPIALLLFLMSKGCVYDRVKDLSPKFIKDVQYIGACGPPGGGRNPVDPRFIALFNVFNLTEPSEAVLRSIYSAILRTRFALFAKPVSDCVDDITSSMLKLYHTLTIKMPRTPSKFHVSSHQVYTYLTLQVLIMYGCM
jgi:dynein heavy chain